MIDVFNGKASGLPVGAYIVTDGPNAGRICMNDDDAFLILEELPSHLREEIQQSDTKLWRLRYEDDDGVHRIEDQPGLPCEYVCFGRIPFVLDTEIMPTEWLRPVLMNDLISRMDGLSNQLVSQPQHSESSVRILHELILVMSEIQKLEAINMSESNEARKVFLCHSSADKPVVRQIYHDLIAAGHEPWLDEFEIRAGESIVEKISLAQEEADALILFLSEESIQSDWVKKEWQAVLMRNLGGSKIRIIPAKLDDCAAPALLSDIKYASFTQSYLGGFGELLHGLES